MSLLKTVHRLRYRLVPGTVRRGKRRNHQESPQIRGYGRHCLMTPSLVDLKVKGAVADEMSALTAEGGDAAADGEVDDGDADALDDVAVAVDDDAAAAAGDLIVGDFDCDQCYCGTFGLSQKDVENNAAG